MNVVNGGIWPTCAVNRTRNRDGWPDTSEATPSQAARRGVDRGGTGQCQHDREDQEAQARDLVGEFLGCDRPPAGRNARLFDGRRSALLRLFRWCTRWTGLLSLAANWQRL